MSGTEGTHSHGTTRSSALTADELVPEERRQVGGEELGVLRREEARGPASGQLDSIASPKAGPRYIGGEHLVVTVSRSISLHELRDRLATAVGCFNIAIKYVRPGEPLDALHNVVTAGDVRDLLDWVLYRDIHLKLLRPNPADIPQVRVFVDRVDGRSPLPEALFTPAPSTPSAAPAEEPVSLPSLKRRTASAP
ncbi:hypothetical protein ZWY2020_025135 [Hordeum vulgare]|nr:hypothetical protein ZWY2020_025135 [Hordeum vulgare]